MTPHAPHEKALSALDPATRAHVEASLALAADLYAKADAAKSPAERARDAERAVMVQDKKGKSALAAMLDRAFRSSNAAVVAAQMVRILRERGIPSFFSWYERFGLAVFLVVARVLPWLLVPIVKAVMRRKTHEVVLPGEPSKLKKHIARRTAQGVRLNLNRLGEMVLGEKEADAKLGEDLALLADPSVDCISVKASNLYSQLAPIAHEHGIRMMASRLRPRLHAAKANGHKLVNLDMEEYRDLAMVVDAFMRVLDEPAFLDLQVGLALQAYIPESYGYAEQLLSWSARRVERGGAPIRIRVVKGANRAMELVDSSQRGLTNPTYDHKVEADANWKAMVELISRPEHLAVCHLGIASHNIFDVAWAAVLIRERGGQDRCLYEMLEGMVDSVHREVQRDVGDVLLYAPAVPASKFLTAIAYLMRRFDELTDPDNFLSHVFGVMPGTPQWEALAAAFVDSVARMRKVSHDRRRTQDRLVELHDIAPPASVADFRNEPDTDWTSKWNRGWLTQEVRGRMSRMASGLPLVVRHGQGAKDRKIAHVYDRSTPNLRIAEVVLANEEDIEHALRVAVDGTASWTALPMEERERLLAAATTEIRKARAELIALAALEVGKPFEQTDAEISEAVDFGVWYPLCARELRITRPGLAQRPLGNGVIAVVSPWNFPCAIPAGGIFAALAAGNRVILKPSPKSRLATSAIAECFWRAGVPKEALQLINCEDALAPRLVADPRIDGVIFTGSTATADRILASRPGIRLFAETGGKNVTMVTANADRELAVKHIAESFRHVGQKCSATSLVLVTPEVYADPEFWSHLVDAVASLPVGSAWNPESVVVPLVGEPTPELQRGLTVLEQWEEWVLKPQRVEGRNDFWTPGIKRGGLRKGFTATTELFGPVISVMCARSLGEMLDIAKETGRGLTLGIESLDAEEVAYVVSRAQAGVVYVNRNTVGAVVGRQSFGGWHGSRRGPGIHAGGSNYVTNFMAFEEAAPPHVRDVMKEELEACGASEAAKRVAECIPAWGCMVSMIGIKSLLTEWCDHFSREHRPSKDVRGEDNVRRYRPLGRCKVVVQGIERSYDALCRIAAAVIAGNVVHVVDRDGGKTLALMAGMYPELPTLPGVEWGKPADDAHDLGTGSTMRHGRIELLRYMQEQTIAEVYHRYGGDLREKDRF